MLATTTETTIIITRKVDFHPLKAGGVILTVTERPTSPLLPFSNVPFAHDPDYIDRTAISNEIHRKLVPGARLALVGLGGVG
jgi:hypothetical protein